MKTAMIGCGKLGLPVALAWATKHDVVGYDVSLHAKEILAARKYPYIEPGAQELLDAGTLLKIVDSVAEAVAHADIVFISVQTPHGPMYEGITRMPETRADFDYSALKVAVKSVADCALVLKKHVVLVVISTVLPGTSERELLPLLVDNSYVSFTYAPMFIAQTTVVEDALKPEFVLLGVDKSDARGIEVAQEFFAALHPVEKLRFMSVASAELTKVAYNCYLGLKIVAANSVMEIAHKTGADCDEVTGALMLATDRVVSPKYMRGGMGDGGACHSRDMIALSWLAQRANLSYDLFGSMVKARESQTEWLANLCLDAAATWRLPIVILGKSYKRGTNLSVGSPAILLRNILAEHLAATGPIVQWDPYVDEPRVFTDSAVFIVAADHDEFFSMTFPKGSVVIDPWGKMRDTDGVKVVRVGRQGAK